MDLDDCGDVGGVGDCNGVGLMRRSFGDGADVIKVGGVDLLAT